MFYTFLYTINKICRNVFQSYNCIAYATIFYIDKHCGLFLLLDDLSTSHVEWWYKGLKIQQLIELATEKDLLSRSSLNCFGIYIWLKNTKRDMPALR